MSTDNVDPVSDEESFYDARDNNSNISVLTHLSPPNSIASPLNHIRSKEPAQQSFATAQHGIDIKPINPQSLSNIHHDHPQTSPSRQAFEKELPFSGVEPHQAMPTDDAKYINDTAVIRNKRGFLARIGLKRQRKEAVQPKEKRTSEDNASQHTLDSSSSSSSIPTGIAEPRDWTPPHHGKYVKIKTNNKGNQEPSRVVLAQTLSAFPTSFRPVERLNGTHPYGAIWTMKFSRDGKYLATAGQCCVVQIWKVLDGTENQEREKDTIQVFHETPIREYRGHMADILDLSWSKSNFLVSSSMDKTVRLWHVTREECLCVFSHRDFVTGVEFHPKDDGFFLSGSLDSRLRLWSIAEKRVAFWTEIPDGSMITSVAFTLDGKTACAGTHTGQCYFFETQGLKYNTQWTFRSSRKRHPKRGRKITGMTPMPRMPPGDEKMLITSNDSRIRLINMNDKSLMFKYKGTNNVSMQIKASFSDDGRHIVCGSENGRVYTWEMEPIAFSQFLDLHDSRVTLEQFDMNSGHPNGSGGKMRWLKRGEKKGAVDRRQNTTVHFDAHQYVVTATVYAPTKTRQLLAKSGNDIIFNNTPVVDVRRSVGNASGSREPLREFSRRSFSGDFPTDNQRDRYHYPESQVIVSSDDTGCIKVWRMDSGIYTEEAKSKRNTIHRKSNSLDALTAHLEFTPAQHTDPSPSSSKGRLHHLGALWHRK